MNSDLAEIGRTALLNLSLLASVKPGFKRTMFKPGQEGEKDYRYATVMASNHKRDFYLMLANIRQNYPVIIIDDVVMASRRAKGKQVYVGRTTGRVVYYPDTNIRARYHALEVLRALKLILENKL